MTVSNLSQAIHFLVENDCLDGVEMTPGEGNQRTIEVMNEDRMCISLSESSIITN